MSAAHRPIPASAKLTRPLTFERALTMTIGVLAVLCGLLALIVGLGWLGEFRAGRRVLDPIFVDLLTRYPGWSMGIAVIIGALLLVLGLGWAVRCARPEGRPDLRLAEELTVAGSALAEAVRADAERVDGVTRARVRLAGGANQPTLRLVLSLREGTDVRTVWEELDSEVLGKARTALGAETIRTAIRLELDRTPRPRVT